MSGRLEAVSVSYGGLVEISTYLDVLAAVVWSRDTS